MVVIVGFLAFVTDFGLAYTNKRAMQNGVDAAALAVAQKIAVDGDPTATCGELEARWEGDPEVIAIADKYFGHNHSTSGAAHSDPVLSCGNSATQLFVGVDTAQESTTFFGGIAGVDGISLAQSAKAVVAPAKTVIGLRPFAMCLGLAKTVIDEPTVNHMLLLEKTDFGCGGASGNWGMMDFDGDDKQLPEGANEALQWIKDGYNGPISIAPPIYIPGETGAPEPGKLEDAMNAMLDDEIVIPVYDLLSGNGSNAQFRVVGFLSIKVCGWKFNNTKKGPPPPPAGQGCFVSSQVPSPEPKDYLQVRYKGFVPIGDVSESCVFANAACDLGTRLYKLAE